jgi:hypothetical protein
VAIPTPVLWACFTRIRATDVRKSRQNINSLVKIATGSGDPEVLNLRLLPEISRSYYAPPHFIQQLMPILWQEGKQGWAILQSLWAMKDRI